MTCVLAPRLALLLCALASVAASLQGLYTTLPTSGQMLLVDWAMGNASSVGASLEAQGWRVPTCTPSSIDPTNKWYFTLARNSSLAVNSPWNVVTASLADGGVVASAPLPPSFPSVQNACDYALCAGGALEVFVSVETPDLRVLAGGLSPEFPHTFALLVNATIDQLGVGRLVSPPSMAVTSSALWLAGQQGVAGAPLVGAAAPPRRLPLSAGSTFRGLHAAPGDVVYSLLQGQGAAYIASFVDTGAGTPSLVRAATSLPPLFSSAETVLTALLSDKNSFALLADGSRLVTANATSGALVSSVLLSCSNATLPLRVGTGSGAVPCPCSIAYEPFVF